MSESTTALLEAPEVDDVDGEATGPDRRRLLLIAGGVGAVLLVAVLAFLFLGGSGTEDEGGLVTPAPRTDAAAAAPVEAAPVDKAPAAYDGDLGRDPFAPVYEPLAADPAADDAAATVDAGATTTGGTGTAGAAGTTTSTDPSAATGTAVTVKLLDVTGDSASVSVDGATYDAKVNGETFATSFRLYSVFDQQCAGLLFGDESVVLCKGDVRTLTP